MIFTKNDEIQKEIHELWQLYEPYIHKLCKYKLKSKPNYIDDCVQDVFVALTEAKQKGIVIKYPKAWLTVIANNKIKDIYEQSKKEVEHIVSQNEEIDKQIYYDDFSIDNITDDDIDELKSNVLSQLSSFEQILIDDYYVKKMKVKEIAEKHMISQSNVKQKLFRARKMIIYLAKKEINEHNT